MSRQQNALVVGGTSGLGLGIATALAKRGERVVITGRNAERAEAVAREIGPGATGMALDLTRPGDIAGTLANLGPIDHLVLAAIERDENSVRKYDVARALRLVTLKLVGYTEVVHTLIDRLAADSAILLIGGLAKDRPYPGSLTVSTVNGGVVAMVGALAVELSPMRVNGLHPGVVGDTAAWRDKPASVLDALKANTPTGRLVTTDEVTEAALFLLDNGGVNGANLCIEGGRLLK